MAHSADKKAAIRNSYINEQLDLKAAALKHDISYATARSWKKKALDENDDWDTVRVSLNIANGGTKELRNQVLQRFYTQSEYIFRELENREDLDPMKMIELLTKWSDAVSKVSKTLGVSNDFDRIGFALELLQFLGSFIKESFPQHANVFLEILEPFGQAVAKQYG